MRHLLLLDHSLQSDRLRRHDIFHITVPLWEESTSDWKNIYVWGLGASYIRDLTVVYSIWQLQCNHYLWIMIHGLLIIWPYVINTLRLWQNGHHFPDDIFKWIFLNENVWISINVSLKFVPGDPINNILKLVQIIAWRRPGDKPLSEPMMVSLLMQICVTRPQWVNL